MDYNPILEFESHFSDQKLLRTFSSVFW